MIEKEGFFFVYFFVHFFVHYVDDYVDGFNYGKKDVLTVNLTGSYQENNAYLLELHYKL